MAAIRCDWCGGFFKESERYPHTCAYCGGPEPEPVKPKPLPETFFYKDWYIVMVRDPMMDALKIRVYAGQELVEEVHVTQWELMNNVKPGYDIMSYIETKLSVVIPDSKSLHFALQRMSEPQQRPLITGSSYWR